MEISFKVLFKFTSVNFYIKEESFEGLILLKWPRHYKLLFLKHHEMYSWFFTIFYAISDDLI